MAQGWTVTNWGKLATLEYGKSLRDYKDSKGQFPVYGTNGLIGWHDSYLSDIPSVIIGRKGAYRGVHYSSRPFFVIDTAFYLKPKIKLDTKWAYYELQTKDINSMDSGSAIPSTSRDEFYQLPVRMPPYKEQRAIAEFLSGFDQKIELNRQTARTLEELAQRLFKSWFVDFDPVRAKMAGRQPAHMPSETAALFPEKLVDSPLGRIPNGWGVKPVLEVCDLRGGAQPPASTFIAEPKLGYVRLLQIRDFSSDSHPTFVPEKKNLKMVTEDDILIGRYGSASGNKGKDSLGRMCRGLAGAYNVALMKLEPKLAGREFSYQIFNSNQFYWYLHGISSKAVQSGFSKKELAQYKVVIPTGDVMQKFEMLAAVFWEKQKLLMRENQTLIELRNRLLPKLIGGKIRVSEAQEIAEEA